MVGYNVTSEPLELAFYGARRRRDPVRDRRGLERACGATGTASSGLWLLSLGFMAGLVTDMVVVYGGG